MSDSNDDQVQKFIEQLEGVSDPPVELDVSDASYQRWLRACRPQPPIPFFELDEAQQEALAQHGDDYTHDVLIAQAYALRNPDAAAMGRAGGDTDAEEVLLKQLADRTLNGPPAGGAEMPPGSPPAAPPLSMGGVSRRRVERILKDRAAVDQGRRLMGRPPDPQVLTDETPWMEPRSEIEELLA
jgi:hypothetical protein